MTWALDQLSLLLLPTTKLSNHDFHSHAFSLNGSAIFDQLPAFRPQQANSSFRSPDKPIFLRKRFFAQHSSSIHSWPSAFRVVNSSTHFPSPPPASHPHPPLFHWVALKLVPCCCSLAHRALTRSLWVSTTQCSWPLAIKVSSVRIIEYQKLLDIEKAWSCLRSWWTLPEKVRRLQSTNQSCGRNQRRLPDERLCFAICRFSQVLWNYKFSHTINFRKFRIIKTGELTKISSLY